jgi:hypothetical protein
MYVPDNADAYTAFDREQARSVRYDCRVQQNETGADAELPWVDVPQDNGEHPELYFKEES